jgi:hypothetical protein
MPINDAKPIFICSLVLPAWTVVPESNTTDAGPSTPGARLLLESNGNSIREETRVREFNQSSLDARLAEIAPNLSPEQAAQVKERVRERVAAGGIDGSPDAIDGAFGLIGGLLSGAIPTPDLGGLSERLTGALAALDPRQLGGGGSTRDLTSQAGDALGGVLAGLGRALGSMPDLAGSLFGKGAEIAGTAAGAAGSIGDFAGNAAGALGDLVDAGDLAGIVLDALGDVLGSLGN